MSRPSWRTAAALLLTVPIALAAGPVVAAHATGSPAAAPVSSQAAPTRVVTLPTGLRVALRTESGRTTVSAAPTAAGTRAGFVTASAAGATYVVPTAAVAGLGTRYVLDDFRVAGAAPAAVTPAFQQYTVSIDAITRQGTPSSNDLIFVQNVDDGRAPFAAAFTYRGGAKVSLAAGHYFLLGFFFSGPGKWVVSLPIRSEVTVAGAQTVTLDARTATVAPTTTTPQPSSVVDAEGTVLRGAARNGFPFSYGAGGNGSTPFYLTPVATPPAHGTMASDTYLRSEGPGYVYDADYPSPAGTPVPAAEHFRPPASAFAAGTTRYFSDGPSITALEERADFAPGLFFVSRALLPVTRPSARTDYVLADPSLPWSQTVVADADAFVGTAFSADTIYAPGDSTSADWFRAPAAPAPIFPTGSVCSACRQGGSLGISYQDFGDSDPSHLVFDDFPGTPGLHESLAFTVSSGGRVLASASGMSAYLGGLPAATQIYTLHERATRQGDGFALATTTDTTWTVPSGDGTGLRVPAGEICLQPTARDCRALPIISPRFTLPIGLDGSMPAGPTTVGLALASPLGTAYPQLSSVQVAVSVEGGATVPATVTRSGSGYAVSFDSPGASRGASYADLTVTASAQDGAAVTQTITRAFALGSGGRGGSSVRAAAGAATSTPAGCATAAAGHAHCDALIATGSTHAATALQRAALGGATKPLPAGYGPADLHAAYGLPATGGAGRTVAVVDAYSDPNAARDLAVYRRTYGLPACTPATGCLRIVDQRGGTALPPPDAGWAGEISLDLDAVSATCPSCRILLVEADDSSFASLAAGVDRAAAMDASAVSNSYGADEFGGMGRYARHYDHPGTAITVSSGDGSFGPAQFPAVLGTVTAVGGTTLTATGAAYRSTAWSGAGSGCSAYVAMPSWQVGRHCAMRTTSDISTVADPDTGLAVYDTFETGYPTSWLVFGGTSASSPVVAAMYTLAGTAHGVRDASGLYSAPAGSITDVVGGSNGYCGGDYLCTAVKGYDGPTGLGSPSGLGAFG